MELMKRTIKQSKEATKATKKVNTSVLKMLPFSNKKDFDDAQRGFIAKLSSISSAHSTL